MKQCLINNLLSHSVCRCYIHEGYVFQRGRLIRMTSDAKNGNDIRESACRAAPGSASGSTLCARDCGQCSWGRASECRPQARGCLEVILLLVEAHSKKMGIKLQASGSCWRLRVSISDLSALVPPSLQSPAHLS